MIIEKIVWGMGDEHALRIELPPIYKRELDRRKLNVKVAFQKTHQYICLLGT